ncbi:glycosyltransferase [Candidatus Desantisbacteria bacterium]|nr:glycosyltransferase [Candidatus Desantisbacteria bacterium]
MILSGYPYWDEDNKNADNLIEIIRKKESDIDNLYYLIQERDSFINALHNSLSWRITFPLRKVLDFILLMKKALYYSFFTIKNQGFSIFIKKAYLFITKGAEIFSGDDIYKNYYQFLQLHKLTRTDVNKIIEECEDFEYKPKISIITPVYNVEPKCLNKCINSVIAQYYQNWELCLYDDASTNCSTIKCLEKWQNKDERIKIKFGEKNLNISGASNEAIKIATGEFFGLLDNDDELTPDALYEIVNALNKDNSIDFIYSDEDKLEMNGTLSGPYFKSNFNLDLFLSNNYICHFSVIRKTIGNKAGWFRTGYEGSQDYDLFLRIIDHTRNIYHIPKVLYHWRRIPGSTASMYYNKSNANIASIKALTDYIKRNNIKGEVVNGIWPGTFRIKRTIISESLVSIIIPFNDKVELLRRCVNSILKKTDYRNFEIILISNNSEKKETFSFVEKLIQQNNNIKYFEYNIPFNFSKINNWAVEQAKGEYILLLNNDIEVISREWLNSMVEHIQREEVGAVGACLLFPDNTIQHAGIILGAGGIANNAFLRKHKSDKLHLTMLIYRLKSGNKVI